MTLDEAITHAEEVAEELKWKSKPNRKYPCFSSEEKRKECQKCSEEYSQLAEWLKELKQLREQTRWIPMTKRPLTDDERECYNRFYIEGAMIFDCPLPEDGQEVLVSYGGYVCVDTFCIDEGCYFEGVDIDEVDAWMPLPEPYMAESENKE